MREETAAVLELVNEERERQRAKWGPQDHNEVEWATVLGEEVGEAAQEALRRHFGGKRPTARFPHERREQEATTPYVAELVQVAAVAVAAIENALYGSA